MHFLNNIAKFSCSSRKDFTLLLESDSNFYTFFENKDGLSKRYNDCIEFCVKEGYDYLVVCHDDVYIHDNNWEDILLNSFKTYDIVGLAGTSEYNIQEKNLWHLSDRSKHSGCVGHGILDYIDYPYSAKHIEHYKGKRFVSCFGHVPNRCLILDGLFLGISIKKIVEKNVKFDEQFKFHHYDMDFCLSCNQKELTLGTCNINVTHLSPGLASFNKDWEESNKKFLKKWK